MILFEYPLALCAFSLIITNQVLTIDSNTVEIEIHGINYKFDDTQTIKKRTKNRGSGNVHFAQAEVAIKEIDFSKYLDKRYHREEYCQEASVARFFRSLNPRPEHIIRSFDDYTDEEAHIQYLVMERASTDLKRQWFNQGLRIKFLKLLANHKTRSKAAELVEDIAIQTAKALAELHPYYIHTGIKPDNFVVFKKEGESMDTPGLIKMVDFQSSMRRVNSNLGNGIECPVYRRFGFGRHASVAPESHYFCNGKNLRMLTTSSDIWAYGTLIRDILFHPFEEATPGLSPEQISMLPTKVRKAYQTVTPIPNYAGRYNADLNHMYIWAKVVETEDGRQNEAEEREHTSFSMLKLGALKQATEAHKQIHSYKYNYEQVFKRKSIHEAHAKSALKPFVKLITVMKSCFQLNPNFRPSASQIVAYLENQPNSSAPQHSPIQYNEQQLMEQLQMLDNQFKSDWEEAKRLMIGGDVVAPNDLIAIRKEKAMPLIAEYRKFLEGASGVCKYPLPEGCDGPKEENDEN